MTTTLLQPNNNPLLHLIDHKAYTSSCVVAITGLKRRGKSLLLSSMLWRDMALYKRKVWSTMPVQTPSFFLKKGYPMVKSMPINFDTLYALDSEYENGTIGLDESIYYDDSRTSLSMKNRLMNAILNQVGHRNLNVYYTVKKNGWMDRRLQDETDIRIECLDLSKTDWGRKKDITPGAVIRLDFFDLSGYFSNHVYDPKYNYKPFTSVLWNDAQRFWDSYDTKAIVGLEDMMTGVKVDMKQRVLSNKGDVNEELRQSMHELARNVGKTSERMPCDAFWNVVESMNIPGGARQLGQYLREIGVKHVQKRGGNEYDFSQIHTGE
jgi:hypothetical protein